MSLDLDDLFDKAQKLIAPSRQWQETFTAPVVKELIQEARALRALERLSSNDEWHAAYREFRRGEIIREVMDGRRLLLLGSNDDASALAASPDEGITVAPEPAQ